MAGSDKRKQSLYFPEDMLKEIQDEATRQDRSLSWIVQKAWKIARKEKSLKYPSVNEFPGRKTGRRKSLDGSSFLSGLNCVVVCRRLRRHAPPVFYESWGASLTATPMLLCDGIGCDGYVWRYLRDDPGFDRPGLHLHYRGHGRTPAPRDPARITIEDLADDVASVLDDALIEQTVIVGHSMGVQVALEAYRRHPSRIAGLVLLCGAPSHPLRTFRGAAQLEELLPMIQRWVQRVPGVVNRLTRWMLPTRLAYEIAARLEIRRELVEPADFIAVPRRHGAHRRQAVRRDARRRRPSHGR